MTDANTTGEQASAVSSRRRLLTVAAAGVGACVAGALGGHWWLTRGAVDGEHAKLLAATFEDLEGKPAPLAQWRGKTLVVNFWATWCGPCREEMPEFVKAQTEFAGKGLQFVGLAVDRKAPVERFIKEIGVNYPVLLADVAWLEAVKTMGNPQGVLPFSLVIAADGQLMLRRVGRLKYSEVAAIFA